MRSVGLVTAVMIVGGASWPQDDFADAPWLASPIFARVTKVDVAKGKVFYAWRALQPWVVHVLDDKKNVVPEIGIVHERRTWMFDLSKGFVLNQRGEPIDSRNALKDIKIGDTVLIVFYNTIYDIERPFPRAYSEAINSKTKILVHQVPDQGTIKEYFGERVTKALIGENP